MIGGTKAAAEAKLAEAASKLRSLAEASSMSVSDLGAKAAQPWDKLETIFEQRVAKALKHLGAPSVQEFEALKTELAALKDKVAALAADPSCQPKAAQKIPRV